MTLKLTQLQLKKKETIFIQVYVTILIVAQQSICEKKKENNHKKLQIHSVKLPFYLNYCMSKCIHWNIIAPVQMRNDKKERNK